MPLLTYFPHQTHKNVNIFNGSVSDSPEAIRFLPRSGRKPDAKRYVIGRASGFRYRSLWTCWVCFKGFKMAENGSLPFGPRLLLPATVTSSPLPPPHDPRGPISRLTSNELIWRRTQERRDPHGAPALFRVSRSNFTASANHLPRFSRFPGLKLFIAPHVCDEAHRSSFRCAAPVAKCTDTHARFILTLLRTVTYG